ncbi:MAG TPA: PP2C family protein-serine/threonine phosphatase [Planctomycetaceae bacterium]|nr:PP2C family protein-serine/threonine phosphatase [Planctomycetaceae bacterium]
MTDEHAFHGTDAPAPLATDEVAALRARSRDPTASADNQFVLQCMDIWSGNRSVENEVSTPGMEIFLSSQPYRGESRGGDVHYVSLCAGGVVTRLILADVSGHGEAVAGVSQALRSLMRRFMNSKSQASLIRDLNREFTQLAQAGRFATAIVATYLSHRNRFMICNAGHPRPLWYCRASGSWSFVNHELIESGRATNLPLGFDESTEYQQFELQVGDGDVFVLYTDGLTEARREDETLLGEAGLLGVVSGIATDDTRAFGHALLQRLRDFSGSRPNDDDVTLLVLKFVAARRRMPGVREKLNAYAKLLGLKAV